MVFDFLRRETAQVLPEARKASATGPLVAHLSSGRVAWSARDTVSLTRSGFAGNPVGFRAVKLIAEAVAALPLVLQDAQRRYAEHPVLSLVSAPNGAQGRAEFLEALVGQILLSGDGYVEAVAGTGAVPLELHVLRSERMRVVPGTDGWPVAYEYSVGGRKHRFDIAPEAPAICHLRSFHPQDDHYGLSPMQAAAQALDVHNSASAWSKGLLDNAARPSGAIIWRGADGQGTLTPEQYDRLVAEVESNHQGARNAGRPMLLGIPGEATYANYAEAHRAFYRLTVLPLATRVAQTLGRWLAGFSGEALELSPDLDRVPALAAERDAQWSRVAGADFLTDAEKRQLLGLPPLAKPDVADD